MRIHEDNSYINNKLIAGGLMRKIPHSIRLDVGYTEEQKAANRAYAEKVGLNSQEWKDSCEAARQRQAEENLKIVEYLSEHLTVGAFRMENLDDCDLWFWCNDLYNTRHDGRSGRDYSYVTLSFVRDDAEQNLENCRRAMELLAVYPCDLMQATIQWSQEERKENTTRVAEKIFQTYAGRFVKLGNTEGKIEKWDNGYIFKKKYSKKYAYRLTPLEICRSFYCQDEVAAALAVM